MAVPAQDQRDWDFATAFDLPIIRTVAAGRRASTWTTAYTGDGPGDQLRQRRDQPERARHVTRPRRAIIAWLEAKGVGEGADHLQAARLAVPPAALLGRAVPDRLRRARACRSRCPRSMLPVELPEVGGLLARHLRPGRRAQPNPVPPLPRATDWVERRPRPGRRGRRPTAARPNVMPQWAGSCWYELRYLDPHQRRAPIRVDPEDEALLDGPGRARRPADPGGVDLYVGGVEHAVLHLLYARFWHKVLYDLGHVSIERAVPAGCSTRATSRRTPTPTPAAAVRRRPMRGSRDGRPRSSEYHWQGEPVTREYGKMGKSLKNVVDAGRDVRRLRRRHVPGLRDVAWARWTCPGRGRPGPSSARSGSCSGCGGTGRRRGDRRGDASPTAEPDRRRRSGSLHRTIAAVPRRTDAHCASTPRSPS